MLFGNTTDGHVGAAKYVSLSVFFCHRTLDAISTRDQAKPGVNLMEEIHERTFQTRFMPTQRSSFNSPPFLHDQQFGAHIFLISSLISCTGWGGGGGKKNHSWGVSENPQPYNIAKLRLIMIVKLAARRGISPWLFSNSSSFHRPSLGPELCSSLRLALA